MLIEYKGKRPNISPTAFIAPTAVIIGDVTVGDEASIWWGAVLRSDQNANPIVIGARTSVQDNCVIHSGEAPTIIEEDCTIGHGAIMEGPLIKRGAIIGMNVTLLGKRRDRRRSADRRRQRGHAAHRSSRLECSPPARPPKSRKKLPAKRCTGSRWARPPTSIYAGATWAATIRSSANVNRDRALVVVTR